MAQELKSTFLQCIKDPEFSTVLRDVMTPMIRELMSEVLASKDEEIAALKSELNATKAAVNELEQYSRRLCLNISGIPESDGENTDNLVLKVATAAGVSMTSADIERSHRVGRPGSGKTRTLVARFTAWRAREGLYSARKNLEASRCDLPADVLKNTFISENLTKTNMAVMYAARQLRRSGKIHSVWSDNCRMKVRKERDGATNVIKTLDDLRDLVGDQPELTHTDRNQGTATASGTDADGFTIVTRNRGNRRGRGGRR